VKGDVNSKSIALQQRLIFKQMWREFLLLWNQSITIVRVVSKRVDVPAQAAGLYGWQCPLQLIQQLAGHSVSHSIDLLENAKAASGVSRQQIQGAMQMMLQTWRELTFAWHFLCGLLESCGVQHPVASLLLPVQGLRPPLQQPQWWLQCLAWLHMHPHLSA